MMKKVRDDDSFTLINLNQWHALKEHAVSFYPQQFLEQVLYFLAEQFYLKPDAIIVICCGHSTRFKEALYLIKRLIASGFKVHAIMPKPLWRNFSYTNLHTLEDEIPENASLLLDLFSAIDAPILNKAQVQFIEKMNQVICPKIALEVPSGIHPDTGVLYAQHALIADCTLHSFHYKQGLWTGGAKSYVGHQVLFKDGESFQSNVHLMHESLIDDIRPKRLSHSHKGSFKRVIVVAGHSQMQGAACMAARAALLMGAGLLIMVYPASEKPNTSHLQEVIWHPLESGYRLKDALHADDILIVGPGLGNDKWACEIWQVIKSLDNQMVIDASALHHLAYDGGHYPNWIITPHPGEAGVLLDTDNWHVQKDRFRASSLLHQKFLSTVVLKGAGTIIFSQSKQYFVCPLGNPGMATPGMGDILSGLIAGLWAQHLSSENAAILAVWYHAKIADSIAKQSLDGVVLASSVLDQIQYGVLGKS